MGVALSRLTASEGRTVAVLPLLLLLAPDVCCIMYK